MRETIDHHIFCIGHFATQFHASSAKDLEYALNARLGVAVAALRKEAYLCVAILGTNGAEVSEQGWSNGYIKTDRNQNVVQLSVSPLLTGRYKPPHSFADGLVL